MSATIFAVSSGAPPAAVAVLRVSGPAAFAAARAIAGRLPAPRRAALRRLRDPISGEPIDRALVLLFPGPDSATGEDVAEFHLHGGRAVVRAMERVLAMVPDCRAAEAGEFTRRALESGRIDLTEAEGFADLLAAETEGQRRAALRSAGGALRRRIEEWTDRVVALSAQIEAAIDHSDEDDAADEIAIVAAVRTGAAALADDIGAVLAQPPVERLRDGIRVVFAGPPNSGKSTLFNAMAGRDAAIVSPIAGTTRDRIEAPVVRDGTAWLLIDTAGLVEETPDLIEALGVERSRESMADADVVLWLGDDMPPDLTADIILIHPRADRADRTTAPPGRVVARAHEEGGELEVWDALREHAKGLPQVGDLPLLNQRQRDLCRIAIRSLCSAIKSYGSLIVAEELRHARDQFDKLTGRASTEQMLDALFSRFCIGK